jgi:acetate kinase
MLGGNRAWRDARQGRRERLDCGDVNVLVLNCGSSTVKFQIIESSRQMIAVSGDRLVAKGSIDRIGSAGSLGSIAVDGGPSRRILGEFDTHKAAIEAVLAAVATDASGVHVDAVGHRVVHGGERFKESVRIDADVEAGIDACVELAPLHNPHNLRGIRACRELFGPSVPQVAVFDTAFHQTMPVHAYLYALPYQYYASYGVRRYGFHGTSHRYVAYRYRTIHDIPREKVRIITCHLGNGCSMTAIDAGASVDTSMGFTPLEGLVMGTRSGDVDPTVLLLGMVHEGLTPAQAEAVVNKQSGLYGLSGLTSDMKTLLAERAKGNDRAALAVEVFCYRIKQYIGRYQAVLGGADAFVFTGGIGENAHEVRALACERLGALGIAIDAEANRATIGREGRISTPEARTAVWVIPTNEELLIARDTVRAIEPEEAPPTP